MLTNNIDSSKDNKNIHIITTVIVQEKCIIKFFWVIEK